MLGVISSYKQAHTIIWKQGCWRFLMAPVLLSIPIGALLIFGCYGLSAYLSAMLETAVEDLFNLPGWLKQTVFVLAFLLQLGPLYILFRGLIILAYAPFLDLISKKAEEYVTGSSEEFGTSLLEAVGRPLLMAFYTILGVIVVLLISFLLGLMPLIGFVLSTAFVHPANLFLSSVGFVDPYLERRGYPPKEALRLMMQHKLKLVLFGLVGLGLTLIPLVGWLLGPAYSVVAGVVMAIGLHGESASRMTSQSEEMSPPPIS